MPDLRGAMGGGSADSVRNAITYWENHLKIYLAAMYSWRDRIRQYADELQALGFDVTSSWLRERANPKIELTDVSPAFLRQHAKNDREDLLSSDAIVLFTVRPTRRTKRGGRHTEFGMAITAGKLLLILGPRENVFHYLPEVNQFEDFAAVKTFLVTERERRKEK